MNYREMEPGLERAYLDRYYFDAFWPLGVVPIPLLPTDNSVWQDPLLDQVAGVIFTGGLDPDPQLWGEALHPQTQLVHPRRQASELSLIKRAEARKMPILGICLGMQMINVARGGSLHQHIPDITTAIAHQSKLAEAHSVRLLPESRLRQWAGVDAARVNSTHHQAVNRLGRGLRAAARAEDGIIEAIEATEGPFCVAVQWHPERAMEQAINRVLLEQFLQAATNGKSRFGHE